MPQLLERAGKILPDEATSSGHDDGATAFGGVSDDDSRAAGKLLPQVYGELRRLAHQRMAALSAGQTLQPTALVHEAYLRLLNKPDEQWRDERHFFLAAARAMHDILVEHARKRLSQKRGGERRRLDLENLEIAEDAPSRELLALEEALNELQGQDARAHQVVLLRYFAGCTIAQAAHTLGVSDSTVESDWRYARAWLHDRLSDESRARGGADAS
jgi:RNA polymerase sigma factor (TIGR02999 family)